MKEYLKQFEKQVVEALAIGRAVRQPTKGRGGVSNVLFCGLGGSAISGDILEGLFRRTGRLPFTVWRKEELPDWIGRASLVICSSYSGNTQEVLEAFREAQRRHAHVWVVTSGGKLASMAAPGGKLQVKIPTGFPPRCALGFLTFSLIPVLKKAGWIRISDAELAEVPAVVRKTPRTQAAGLAKKLAGKRIHLYAFSGLMETAAYRWRTQFAENAKVLAGHHAMPEIFHNEIEAWTRSGPFYHADAAVFLTDRDDPASIQRKRRVAEELVRQAGAKVFEIKSRGRSPLARLFSVISFGDWVSAELAERRGCDPLQIPNIDAIKKVN